MWFNNISQTNLKGVEFRNRQLEHVIHKYKTIYDCIQGERTIKEMGEVYLPKPVTTGDRDYDEARYKAYKLRARFYDITRQTMDSLVGRIFAHKANVDLPAQFDVIQTNVDGSGVALDQQAESALGYVVAYARSGLFVDFPSTRASLSVKDVETQAYRPTITAYQPWDIINWDTKTVNSETILTKVVLRETYTYKITDDEFAIYEAAQYRVLRLEPAGYSEQVYRELNPTPYTDMAHNDFFGGVKLYPTDSTGKPWMRIPFTFVGAKNNDSVVDEPLLYGMATLNIGHYINSADYEEACFTIGQPMLVITGLTKDWATEVLGDQIYVGSRRALMLPINADAKLLQVMPNSMPKEAMLQKQQQMEAIGAQVVQQSRSNKTATEAGQENTKMTSVLAMCAQNLSSAYTQALKWCAKFLGVSDSNIVYQLNTDFTADNIDGDDRRSVYEVWKGRAMTFSELRAYLKRGGLATTDDKTAATEILNDKLLNYMDSVEHPTPVSTGGVAPNDDASAKKMADPTADETSTQKTGATNPPSTGESK
jgi:hypothetical protein